MLITKENKERLNDAKIDVFSYLFVIVGKESIGKGTIELRKL
jgi:hypothetical protein